jgi:4-hydroxythreonine-4-phosphate dehydrogenase
MGDPAGIGPEIVVKALADARVHDAARPLVIGDASVLAGVLGECGVQPAIHVIEAPDQGRYEAGAMDLIDLRNVDLSSIERGQVQADCGRAAYEYVEHGVRLALAGAVDALATAPINKAALQAAGVPHLGHTEILAHLTDVSDPLTMFEVCGLRIFFLTRHLPLRAACDLVTKQRVLDYIQRCTEALDRLGIEKGTLAVAGLNPHSGEGGLLGTEETTEVIPAIREAQRRGYEVEGPIAADSVFHLGLQGRFAAVLSMYHDQGHVAAKTFDFERTIAVTNGLPFLRTSVDHGTAFDIAGTGQASAVSMIEAILLAARYASRFA